MKPTRLRICVIPYLAALIAVGCGTTGGHVTAGSAPTSLTVPTIHEPHLVEAERVSVVSGWVLTTDALLWTSDGGLNWVDITPSGYDADRILGVHFRGSHGLLGVEGTTVTGTTWSAWYEALVLSTDDAGKSWSRAGRLLTPLEPTHILFSTAGDRAFALVQLASGSAFDRGMLFTANGSTWSQPGSELPASQGIAFANEQVGAVAGGPDQTVLIRTLDGGRTWTPIHLGDPADSVVDGVAAAGGRLVIAITDRREDAVRVFTSSDGSEWAPSGVVTVPPGARALPTAIVAPDEWYVGTDAVYRFSGARAARRPSQGLRGTVIALSFPEERAGWVLASESRCPQGKDSCAEAKTLYGTDDGGDTLVQLLPRP